MGQPDILPRQREDAAARLRAEEHQVVLWVGRVCRQGHQADDEQWQDHLQEDQH